MSDLDIQFQEAHDDSEHLFTHLEAIRKQYKMSAKETAALYLEWLEAKK
jgi:hypothetical protein